MQIRFTALALAVLGFALLPANAQHTADSAKPAGAFQQDFLLPFEEAESKVLNLAKAIPAERYSWRPAPGVRSVGEVYMHIAGGNRLLLMFAGAAPAQAELVKMIRGNEDREKTITVKSKVVEQLEASFKAVHEALAKATEVDLSKPVKFFDSKTTLRGIFLVISNHVSEHLGQSIAYSRMNNIIPPWSRGPAGK
ncbi:MAG: damage-inducible protein DinB [Acidobacteria bacterium]|nr:MAG: damage-inducible protein DinB [Acidobacteriota bacterium]